MRSIRADLNYDENNSLYLGITVVLLILSILGVIALFWVKSQSSSLVITASPAPNPELAEGPTPASDLEAEEPTPLPSIVSDSTPSPKSALQTPTPTPAFREFTSLSYRFSVTHSSSRRVYQDKEGLGNRYTFYSAHGNIVIHVGPQWSWIYPTRVFTADMPVATHSTFVYDISTQTITDFEIGDLKYTIQCIHNGDSSVKSECLDFISGFTLL